MIFLEDGDDKIFKGSKEVFSYLEIFDFEILFNFILKFVCFGFKNDFFVKSVLVA